jgi:uncharacterized protein
VLNGLVEKLERLLFRKRSVVLLVIGIFTAVLTTFALQLRMDAGYEKQMPTDHEYIRTFQKYRDDLFGANRITVVVRVRSGTIWTPAALKRLYQVTQAITYLPNVDRGNVQSLWTPNSVVNEITEDGFRADPLIPGTVTPEDLTPAVIDQIRSSADHGGFKGVLVSHDEKSAMITAELNETDLQGNRLDYIKFNHVLEHAIRQRFEDAGYEIQITGFSKQIGEIADGASSVMVFCAVALFLTALAVYWYCRSVRFTVLPIVCSLTSLTWQFGTLKILGFGLDPLAVLVPFLVFAIGVSHGIQQINFIVRELSYGKSPIEAARRSFSGLLVPGTLALVTAFVSFVTLLLIPIPMVRELAITASLGVVYKIITNLVMLPLVASYFAFPKGYASASLAIAERRARYLKGLTRLASLRNAYLMATFTMILLCVSAWESRDRVVGTLQRGAPELREDSRFNRDAVSIATSYDVGLDWLSVIFEKKQPGCDDARVGLFVDDFSNAMRLVPGVLSVSSYSDMLRTYNEGYNEGNPKMYVVPIDPENYGALSTEIARVRGYTTKACGMTAAHLYLSDHKAKTINGVIDAVRHFRQSNPLSGVTIRLAAGNVGVIAAINDEVSKSETPMMLYVYAAIVLLVYAAYRDIRAVIACCLPLTVATFVGYWFMKQLEIGLTVATLPVMVLAVGIGVDYAFYIYNRIQHHLAEKESITKAIENSILEVGVATIFTAITLALGVATWSFSALKFQADMGKLLSFMFIVNLVMAMTALPALAIILEHWFPRRRAVRAPGMFSH